MGRDVEVAFSGKMAARAATRAKLVGDADGRSIYECSRYTWWDSRQNSVTEADRKFANRRSALLYVARRNSDELAAYSVASGRAWAELTPTSLVPNEPFDAANLFRFLELDDAAVERYGQAVANAFNVHKPPEGTILMMAARLIDTTGTDELLGILEGGSTAKARAGASA